MGMMGVAASIASKTQPSRPAGPPPTSMNRAAGGPTGDFEGGLGRRVSFSVASRQAHAKRMAMGNRAYARGGM